MIKTLEVKKVMRPKITIVKPEFKPMAPGKREEILARMSKEHEEQAKEMKGKLPDSTKYPKWR